MWSSQSSLAKKRQEVHCSVKRRPPILTLEVEEDFMCRKSREACCWRVEAWFYFFLWSAFWLVLTHIHLKLKSQTSADFTEDTLSDNLPISSLSMLRHTSIWRGMRFRGLLEDMDSSCSTSFLIPARRNKCSHTILSWSRLRMDSPTLRAAQRRTWKDTVHVFLCSGALWSSLHGHYLLLFPFSPHWQKKSSPHRRVGFHLQYITQEGHLNPLLMRLDVLSWIFLVYGLGYVD